MAACALSMLAHAHASEDLKPRAGVTAYGELPPGALSTNEVTDVSAEICRDHLFDPKLLRARLPEGYRLVPAAEYAKGDPAVADLVKGDGKHRAYAVGSLCFMSVGSFVVDGVRVPSAGPTPMAFWWAQATGPRDSRMQGKVEWVQLASWYSNRLEARDRVLATDPTARFVDLDVAPVEPGLWRLRLALEDEVIEAEVRSRGPREPRKAPQPGFMSVPFAGVGAGSFWVITYFGHHHRPATGEWRARGSGVFRSAFGIPGEAAAFRTHFQEGWSALSGVYKSLP